DRTWLCPPGSHIGASTLRQMPHGSHTKTRYRCYSLKESGINSSAVGLLQTCSRRGFSPAYEADAFLRRRWPPGGAGPCLCAAETARRAPSERQSIGGSAPDAGRPERGSLVSAVAGGAWRALRWAQGQSDAPAAG